MNSILQQQVLLIVWVIHNNRMKSNRNEPFQISVHSCQSKKASHFKNCCSEFNAASFSVKYQRKFDFFSQFSVRNVNISQPEQRWMMTRRPTSCGESAKPWCSSATIEVISWRRMNWTRRWNSSRSSLGTNRGMLAGIPTKDNVVNAL